MSQVLQVKPYIEGYIQANKGVERLALRVFRKGGSSRSASTYVENVKVFAKWLNISPDEALSKGLDWAKVLNDYVDVLLIKDNGARGDSLLRHWPRRV